MALIDTHAKRREILSSRSTEVVERTWRDKELKETDYIVSLMDFTPDQDWLTYRQELRDWPSTDNFPITKPIRPDKPTPEGY